MNKELEALKTVSKKSLWDCYNDEPHTKKEKEAYDLLVKALTPPIADEVCKALSEDLNCEVTAEIINGRCDFKMDGEIIIHQFHDREDGIHITSLVLSQKTLLLLGRFYENEVTK